MDKPVSEWAGGFIQRPWNGEVGALLSEQPLHSGAEGYRHRIGRMGGRGRLTTGRVSPAFWEQAEIVAQVSPLTAAPFRAWRFWSWWLGGRREAVLPFWTRSLSSVRPVHMQVLSRMRPEGQGGQSEEHNMETEMPGLFLPFQSPTGHLQPKRRVRAFSKSRS